MWVSPPLALLSHHPIFVSSVIEDNRNHICVTDTCKGSVGRQDSTEGLLVLVEAFCEFLKWGNKQHNYKLTLLKDKSLNEVFLTE